MQKRISLAAKTCKTCRRKCSSFKLRRLSVRCRDLMDGGRLFFFQTRNCTGSISIDCCEIRVETWALIGVNQNWLMQVKCSWLGLGLGGILRIKINIPQRERKTSVILCVNYIFHNLNILSWDSGGRRVAQQRESACFALAWLQSVHETFARVTCRLKTTKTSPYKLCCLCPFCQFAHSLTCEHQTKSQGRDVIGFFKFGLI